MPKIRINDISMYYETYGAGAPLVLIAGFSADHFTWQIGAEQDIIFPPSTTEALAKAIPSAAYYCFKSCGHLPHTEYPEKFIEIVTDFLRR